jgi:hypothetical protein
MIFDWYKVINRAEFVATGLVSREVSVILEGVGAKTILVTIGNLFSITVDEVILSIGVTSANPFVFQDRAVYVDANDDVWYGILSS